MMEMRTNGLGNRDQLRIFKIPNRIWYVIFFVFAGPLNPVIWLAPFLFPPNTTLGVFFDNPLWTTFLPAVILALLVLRSLHRAEHFTKRQISKSCLHAWIWAVVTSPLTFIAIPLVQTADLSMLDSLFGLLALIVVFGTISGIIPLFALVIGVPCALFAYALAYATTQPVVETNTSLPKRTKPV